MGPDAEPADTDYDVVMALNYYTPYVSGLTEAARKVAEGLVSRGWRIAVVAGQHEKSLARRETLNGVDVFRTRVAVRFGKGIVSPGFVPMVRCLARRSRSVMMHLPMLEAGVIASAVGRTPLLSVYQCDVTLPEGLLNTVQERLLDRSHRLAFSRSKVVVVSSEDYAQHSRLWNWIRGREVPISPPATSRPQGTPRFRDSEGITVGFLGRIVEEKGVDFLVTGFRGLADPTARLLIGGDYAKVAGGSVIEKVRAAAGDDPRVTLLGFLADEDLADFYASLDVFALPSINALEAYGITQVEAMMAGVAVIASDLPGVRQPVLATGGGIVVPPRDSAAITEAITELASRKVDREALAAAAVERYETGSVVDQFARLITRTVPGTGAI